MKWTAALVLDAIREAMNGNAAVGADGWDEWTMLTEVPLRYDHPLYLDHRRKNGKPPQDTRTIDALMVRHWESGPAFKRYAIEVKVSRSDYRNETDQKRRPAEHSAHGTFYAAPAGVIDPETLPEGWGLVEVYETAQEAMRAGGHGFGSVTSRVRWRRQAARREPDCDMDYLVSAIARVAGRSDRRLRLGEDRVADVANLIAEQEKMTGQVERAFAARDLARQRVKHWQGMYLATQGAQECADCEKPIKWSVRRTGWEHASTEDERACHQVRAERIRQERESSTGAHYLAVYAGDVEPKALRETESLTPSEGTT